MFNLLSEDVEYLLDCWDILHGEGKKKGGGGKLRNGDRKFIERIRGQYA